MKVLVTNDDGVGSPGLHALARALVDAGHDVVVVAPDRDYSGSGAAIGHLHADDHIDAAPVELPGLAGLTAFIWYALPDYVVSKRRRALAKSVLLLPPALYGASKGREIAREDPRALRDGSAGTPDVLDDTAACPGAGADGRAVAAPAGHRSGVPCRRGGHGSRSRRRASHL